MPKATARRRHLEPGADERGREDAGPCRVMAGVVGQPVKTTALADAIRHDAAALLDAYRTRTWTPAPEEHAFAEALARARWSGASFRAAFREVPAAVRSGRLIDALEPAAAVLDDGAAGEDTVLQLRVLVDALAAAAVDEDAVLDTVSVTPRRRPAPGRRSPERVPDKHAGERNDHAGKGGEGEDARDLGQEAGRRSEDGQRPGEQRAACAASGEPQAERQCWPGSF